MKKKAKKAAKGTNGTLGMKVNPLGVDLSSYDAVSAPGVLDEKPSLGKVTLTVTGKVLAVSERECAGKCMVAQAIRLLGAEYTDVRVTSDTASFNFRGWRYVYQMPAKAAWMIAAFDESGAVPELGAKIQLQRPAVRPVAFQGPRQPKGSTTGSCPRVKRERRTVVGPRFSVRRYRGVRTLNPPAA